MNGEQHNGAGESRLDRMERIMELVIADHVKFQEEHKQLLTAQVVLTDKVDKLADTVAALARHTDERFAATDERLNALIHVVDEWIRGHPPRPS